jgi:hypothetical protein
LRGAYNWTPENTAVKALTDNEIRADRLRFEIAQLEARYDGLFPPGVYSVLESLRRELVALITTA